MSSQLQDQENFVQASIARSRHHKRLRLIFTAVFFSRGILSATKNVVRHKTNSKRSRSYTAIEVEPEASYSNIDKASLSKLVEEENLGQLQILGRVNGVVAALKTDAKNGIRGDYEDIVKRQKAYGSNTYENPLPKSLFYFVLKAFKDPMIILLIVTAAFSLWFGTRKHGLAKGWSNGGSIFLAVLVVIIASSVNTIPRWKCLEMSGCSKLGDVVCPIGDKIPADGLFLHGHSFSVDKSSLTANSNLIEVNCNQKPFLHSGSMVADGFAQMFITSVGMNTTWGKMVRTKWKDSQETTPLQVWLHKIASITSKTGLSVALSVLLVWLVRYFMGKMTNGYVWGKTDFHAVICALVGIATTVVAIAAGAVAEGLPLAVIITIQ
ncbi:calcium-transporting ATPase 12, plasma membrane-type-like [Ricinus communis]|uniref:calcium-transporting ATPase 12, plasma membrane-type-like n=1 Tax=Ricinus communis TaxID=3988 RepID=UPI00201AC44C|nr:calcium-transporting ATPase 12, plasma membrane-type-like [Ricinus communis]